LLAVVAIVAPAASAEGRWASAEANLYWPLKEARIRAYRERDRAFFERLLAANFVSLAPDGRRVGRDEYLEGEFGGDAAARPKVETTVEDFTAVRNGAVVVLAYKETERSAVGANTFEVHLGRLDVYVRVKGRWQLQTMTAVRLPEAPVRIDVPAAKLAAYEGRYAFASDVVSVVRVEGARLLEQTTGNPESELVPIGPDLFYAPPDLEARVSFERDAAGRVVAQIYRSGSQVLRAPKVGP
jgi:hypothetical protein